MSEACFVIERRPQAILQPAGLAVERQQPARVSPLGAVFAAGVRAARHRFLGEKP
jgi:hypothetical protein